MKLTEALKGIAMKHFNRKKPFVLDSSEAAVAPSCGRKPNGTYFRKAKLFNGGSVSPKLTWPDLTRIISLTFELRTSRESSAR
jgi:hypothetical protein